MTQGQIEDLFDIVFKIKDRLDEVLKEKTDFPESKYNSPHIDQVSEALAEAQGTYRKVIPTQGSPGGLYANLDDILIACRSALRTNKLCFRQYLELEDAGTGAKLLKTVIGHASGQWLASYERIVPGKTDRETGNRVETYKRIQAKMLLGVSDTGNDPIAFDDNGELQAENILIDTLKKPNEYKPKAYSKEVITKDNYNELLITLGDDEVILDEIKQKFGIESLADLPKEKYHETLAEIRRVQQIARDFLKGRK